MSANKQTRSTRLGPFEPFPMRLAAIPRERIEIDWLARDLSGVERLSEPRFICRVGPVAALDASSPSLRHIRSSATCR